MAIDFEKVATLKRHLHFELSLATHFCLSNQDTACGYAIDRLNAIRELIKQETTIDKIAGG